MRFSRPASQSFPLALSPVLRRSREHLNQVVMQAIVKLALEAPLELWMIEVTGMQVEVIGVYWNAGVLELDDDLYPFSLAARTKIQ